MAAIVEGGRAPDEASLLALARRIAQGNPPDPDDGDGRLAVYDAFNNPDGKGTEHDEAVADHGRHQTQRRVRGQDDVYFVKLRWTCSTLNLNTVGGWFLVLLFVWFIS